MSKNSSEKIRKVEIDNGVFKINNKKIEDIDIVKSLFPSNDDTQIEVAGKLGKLQEIIISL